VAAIISKETQPPPHQDICLTSCFTFGGRPHVAPYPKHRQRYKIILKWANFIAINIGITRKFN